MDKTAVQAAFIAAGLSQRVKDIDALARPSIRLFTAPVDESSLPVGVSKLGGLPDLPAGTVWPEWNGFPQSFLAQIHLDDLYSYDVQRVLPQHGMLWFFYDAQQQTFGESPADAGGWHVLFKEDLRMLQRTPFPTQLPSESRFHACNIRFACEITLPQQPELELANFDWTDEEVKRYETLLSQFPDPADRAAIHHRMLGYADALQDDMRLQSQLMTHGVTSPDDPCIDELSKGASDWQLLLQVDSDEHAGMCWATAGIVYYWIKLADLQACRFDQTWLVLQSE
jgi:uncharacterized protein YwqG